MTTRYDEMAAGELLACGVLRVCTGHVPEAGTDVARPDGDGSTSYAELTLSPEGESASAARRFLRATFERWMIDETVIELGELLVSELVTNAILHARTPLTLRLQRSGSQVRVGVSDGEPRVPVRRRMVATDISGRGLAVIDHLVRGRWEAVSDGYGKTVWCELDVAPLAAT